jgi:hypothetical protein
MAAPIIKNLASFARESGLPELSVAGKPLTSAMANAIRYVVLYLSNA